MSNDTTEYGPTLRISKEIHAMKYRSEGESFKEGCTRFSNALADNPGHFQELRKILLDMRFLGGGRTQAAIGSPRNVTAFNCFVSGTIEDSMDSIMEKAAEAAQTMRLGGGIGYDFSTLRPRGDNIVSLDSRSSGPISFMAIFDAICHTISSAGHRRGAQMGVLRVDHPDIEEFIRAKQNETNLKAFNISVGITDEFMEAVKTDTMFDLKFEGKVYSQVKATALWDEIMQSTWNWAEPGVLFIDRIKEMNNLYYCEDIVATNPCLHPDTMVETIHGRVRIADIKEPTKVYTMLNDGSLGIRRATASFVTKRDAETLAITTRNNKQISVTPDHKIQVHGKGWVKAKDLQIGDRLVQLCRARRGVAYSGVKLTTEDNRAYQMEHVMVADSYYGVKDDEDVHHIDGDTYNNSIDNLEVLSHSEHSKHTATNDNPQTHQVKGERGRFIATGISPKTIQPMPDELRSKMKNKYSNAIVDISPGDVTDVYDITVEDTHNLIGDFIVVHNCGEQPLPPYGACLLGSFNLVKYLKKTEIGNFFDYELLIGDIPTIVRAMDNIHDNTTFPLPQQEQESKDKRRMGLGVTGVANAGEMLGHVYGSSEFNEWLSKVMEVIRDEVYAASVELAKEKGSFPAFDAEKYTKSRFIQTLPQALRRRIKKYGIRNSHLLSIAPTGTISLAADNISSGIEPVFSHFYDRTIQTFEGAVVERVEDYAYRTQGIKGKTANECTASEHLGVLAIAQKYVDSACSKTINVDPSMPWEDFKQIYIDAYDQGCKGCTTFNSGGKRFGILNAPSKEEDESEGAKACYVNLETGQKECS